MMPSDTTTLEMEEMRAADNSIERKLYEEVEKGNENGLNDILKQHNKVNWKWTSETGFTILQNAIFHRNKAIIKHLCQCGCPIDSGLSMAMDLNDQELINYFLEEEFKIENYLDEVEADSVEITDDSPRDVVDTAQQMMKKGRLRSRSHARPRSTCVNRGMMESKKLQRLSMAQVAKAASMEDVGLIEKFYKDKWLNKLETDDLFDFSQTGDENDPLKNAEERIQTCQVLTSHSYLLIVDNVNAVSEAMKRSGSMKKLAVRFPANKEQFENFAMHSSELPLKILDYCDNASEVKSIFQDPHETTDYGSLKEAFQYEQKKFIAHPKCQNVLYHMWLTDFLLSWQGWPILPRIRHVLTQAFFMPVFCLLWSLGLRHSWLLRRTKVPLNRFIYAALSYLFLLFLIIFRLANGNQMKNRSLNYFDFIILVWLLGHSVKIIYNVTSTTIYTYKSSWWTRCEMFTIFFFLVYFVALTTVTTINQFHDNSNSHSLSIKVALAVAMGAYPVFVTAAIFRVLQWFYLNRSFGHLIVSLSRMINITFQLLLIFGIVLFAFSIGLFTLNVNYRVVDETHNSTSEESLVISYFETIRTLIWVLFGEGEVGFIDEKITANTQDTEYWHASTIVGHIMWAIFVLMFAIILLNMMIAILNNLFQIIADNFDTEWKYARAHLWIDFFEEFASVPPPFNLLATITSLIISGFQRCCRKQRKPPSYEDTTDAHTKIHDGKHVPHIITIEKLIKKVRYEDNIKNVKANIKSK